MDEEASVVVPPGRMELSIVAVNLQEARESIVLVDLHAHAQHFVFDVHSDDTIDKLARQMRSLL